MHFTDRHESADVAPGCFSIKPISTPSDGRACQKCRLLEEDRGIAEGHAFHTQKDFATRNADCMCTQANDFVNPDCTSRAMCMAHRYVNDGRRLPEGCSVEKAGKRKNKGELSPPATPKHPPYGQAFFPQVRACIS
ncbi:hypothetical protein KM043_013770 [Ampulex compressa]|nr:hypothetical protein KM043_013770 [Ampulex compressa]